ncbi:hypothetical protein J7J13_02390 [bacterium]|nr:hypothetical protein [bacterium]
MRFKIPKNTEKYYWTRHSIGKMMHYGLSAQRILRVIRSPQRTEKGIVKNTIAVMQPASTRIKDGKRFWSREIWAMYQTREAGNSKFKILNSKQIQNSKLVPERHRGFKILNSANQQIRVISAWIYPGISPKNNPIPEDILRELEEI